jgi:hypothetical protein
MAAFSMVSELAIHIAHSLAGIPFDFRFSMVLAGITSHLQRPSSRRSIRV